LTRTSYVIYVHTYTHVQIQIHIQIIYIASFVRILATTGLIIYYIIIILYERETAYVTCKTSASNLSFSIVGIRLMRVAHDIRRMGKKGLLNLVFV